MNEADAKAALKFYLHNSDRIDPALIMRRFALDQPSAFNSFLSEITGLTVLQLTSKVLRHDPSAFLAVAEKTISHADTAVKIAALMLEHVRTPQYSSRKIDAIKELRHVWGFRLREAKDIADALQQHIEDNRPFTGRTSRHSLLNEEQLEVLALVMGAVTL